MVPALSNWLQAHSGHFAHFPHPSLAFDGAGTGELGQNNATMPTAAQLSGWTIPRDRPCIKTIQEQETDRDPLPIQKLNLGLKAFSLVLLSSTNAQIKDWRAWTEYCYGYRECGVTVFCVWVKQRELAHNALSFANTHVKKSLKSGLCFARFIISNK